MGRIEHGVTDADLSRRDSGVFDLAPAPLRGASDQHECDPSPERHAVQISQSSSRWVLVNLAGQLGVKSLSNNATAAVRGASSASS